LVGQAGETISISAAESLFLLEGGPTVRIRFPPALSPGHDHHGADAAGGFPLALRQTEGLIASLLQLLGLDLAAPDHSTISRRGAANCAIPRARDPSR